MAYGSAHTSTIPTVSSTVGPTYATQINAAIAELRTTVDAKVTPAGMSMTADLSFLVSGTYSGVKDLFRANFENKGAAISAATYPNALYVVSGDLYYNDASGRQVRVTNAGALNIAATGGITGSGYGSGGVEVNWAVADTAYKLKSGASTYAHAWLRNVYLNDGDTNFLRLIAPALASDYSITFPAAAPGSTLPVLMDSSGVLSTSGTLANLVSITTSGAASIGTTLGVTGLITATAGLTAAANQHVTVSGTGRFKHGTFTEYVHASSGTWDGDQWTLNVGYVNMNASGIGGSIWIPITLPVGKRITGVTADIKGDAVNRLTAKVYSITNAGSRTELATEDSAASATNQSLVLATGNVDVVSGTMYYADISLKGGDAADATLGVYGIGVTFTEP